MEKKQRDIIFLYGEALMLAGNVEGGLGIIKAYKKELKASPSAGLLIKSKFLPQAQLALEFIKRFERKSSSADAELFAACRPKIEEAKTACLNAIAFYEQFQTTVH